MNVNLASCYADYLQHRLSLAPYIKGLHTVKPDQHFLIGIRLVIIWIRLAPTSKQSSWMVTRTQITLNLVGRPYED